MKTKIILMMVALATFSQTFAQRPFNKSKDILIAQFDSKPDPDDIHAQAALGSMLAHSDFDGVEFYAVAGAIGKQGGRFIDSDALFDMAFGSGNWTDADANRSASVTRIKNKVKPILQNGGKVWVQEAGQSDITRDWIQALKDDGVASNIIKSNVVVVQHSKWNEDMTSNGDLNWVKNNANYKKIADGNSGGNGTPGYRSTTKSFLNQAKASNNPNTISKALWTEADRVIQAHGHKPSHSSISTGGVDYSDCVENWWIFSVEGNANTIAKFWSRYVTNATGSGNNGGGNNGGGNNGGGNNGGGNNGGGNNGGGDTGCTGQDTFDQGVKIVPNANSWTDSYKANGYCFCKSSFDHGVGNFEININGQGRNIRAICDELKKHPEFRNLRNGDPRYNTVQCGNEPGHGDAITIQGKRIKDEKVCPGRVDQGSKGCKCKGPKFDMEWLSSRERFGGNNGGGNNGGGNNGDGNNGGGNNGSSQTVTLSPIQDAYTQGNNGINNNLIRIEKGRREGFLMFDLSSINGTITDVKLEFTVTGDRGQGQLTVHKGNSNNWTETNLSNANKPAPSDLLGSINKTYVINNKETVDLQESAISGNSLSLVLRATSGSDFAFASKENGGNPAAKLVVTFSSSRSNAKNSKSIKNDVVLFPNPANNILTLMNVSEKSIVSATDITGKLINITESKVGNGREFNVSNLNTGIYFIILTDEENKTTTLKFSKQ